jgi:hypothetical protein
MPRRSQSAETYRALRSELIIKTLGRLKARIEERFPGRGLGSVAGELLVIAEEDAREIGRLLRPFLWARASVALFLVAGVAVQAVIVMFVSGRLGDDWNVFDLFQGVDAALNTLLLMGAGVFFFMSLEERLKRGRILKDLHELRSIAHVIDMHQLTKDPAALGAGASTTRSSPARDMTAYQLVRYLDYCAEMLSLTGKLAALYAQNTRDAVIIQAVNEIENLTTALSGKIWQKIMIIRAENGDETLEDAET